MTYLEAKDELWLRLQAQDAFGTNAGVEADIDVLERVTGFIEAHGFYTETIEDY